MQQAMRRLGGRVGAAMRLAFAITLLLLLRE